MATSGFNTKSILKDNGLEIYYVDEIENKTTQNPIEGRSSKKTNLLLCEELKKLITIIKT